MLKGSYPLERFAQLPTPFYYYDRKLLDYSQEVFDVLMVVSFIALVLMMIFGKTLYYVIFIILALLVLSINMHCIFNGRVVRTIIYKNEERRKS